jgi:type IV pilus assembly protein PilB
MNQAALDDIRCNMDARNDEVLVKDDEGAKMLNSVLAECDAMAVMKGLTHEDLENVDVAAGDGAINLGAASSKIDDAPVVRFINKAMLDAINEKVSDIHFEAYEKT